MNQFHEVTTSVFLMWSCEWLHRNGTAIVAYVTVNKACFCLQLMPNYMYYMHSKFASVKKPGSPNRSVAE